MSRTPQEELTHFLSDMYSVEQQALAQLVTAPRLAGDAAFAEDLRAHELETEGQSARVEARLKARGGEPSLIKDAIMRIGGKGFLLFALVMPETPGRLLAHCYSYEAMEWAGYQMLEALARYAGDEETAQTAAAIAAEERRMLERLENHYDGAEGFSHEDATGAQMKDHVERHLKEAHALEQQSVKLMEKARDITDAPKLRAACDRYAEQSRRHAGLIEDALKADGASPSAIEDSALAAAGYNWGLFFQAQADTSAKLGAFVYAVGHLKIAGYELLRRTMDRAGDAETANFVRTLLAEERGMTAEVAETFPQAVLATFAEAAE